jgi:hypothetical protein
MFPNTVPIVYVLGAPLRIVYVELLMPTTRALIPDNLSLEGSCFQRDLLRLQSLLHVL